MHPRSVVVLLCALPLAALPTGADAVVLPFTGSLEVHIGDSNSFFEISTTMTGASNAVVNGSSASGHLSSLAIDASVFQSGVVEVVASEEAFPFVGVQLDVANQAGNFSGSGGAGFGGSMPLAGGFKLCTYPDPCSDAVANLTVPLTVVGRSATRYVGAALGITVVGAPWTTGTAAVGTLTLMGGASPLSGTGAESGVLTLVTPIFISTLPGAYPVIPAYAVMTLRFVPEPATLVLLGTALCGVAAYGRHRARG